eukprot:Gb_06521 [translate_table: standard]
MSKNKKLSNIMIEECVKEISRLRTENKSLKNRMVSIESMARKEPHVRQKPKYKPQGISAWKGWNRPYYGRVPKVEEIKRQRRDQLEREFTGIYIPPQIEVITPKGVLVKVDPLNDAQVFQEDGTGRWIQCEDENT